MPEADQRGPFLKVVLAAFERRRNVCIRDHDGLGVLAKLRERFLLQALSPVLVDQRAPVLFGISIARPLELGAVLLVRFELVPDCLDLAVSRARDVHLAGFQLQLFRLLNQDLLVDQVVQDGFGHLGLAGRVGGNDRSLRAPLVDRGEDIAPENRLVADDRDNSVHGHDLPRDRNGRNRALRGERGGHECAQRQESFQHRC